MLKHMRELRETVGSGNIVLSLSLGKDSVASLILCSLVFDNIFCVTGEQLPRRARDRKYAEYLRQRFPKIRDMRFYPHPIFLDKLNENAFASPEMLVDPFCERGGEPEDLYGYHYEGMKADICHQNGLDPDTIYQAVGVKMSDSVRRRISLTRIGYINYKDKLIYPIRDFSVKQVYELLKFKGIRLHPDYKYYGSSFDGMGAKYWVKAYRSDPETWSYIEAYFPMAKTYVYKDLFKREMNSGKN